MPQQSFSRVSAILALVVTASFLPPLAATADDEASTAALIARHRSGWRAILERRVGVLVAAGQSVTQPGRIAKRVGLGDLPDAPADFCRRPAQKTGDFLA
jgi:hypothetical protein